MARRWSVFNGAVLATVLAGPATAQRCPDGASAGRVALVAGGYAAAEAAAIAVRHDDWWTTPTRSFYASTGGSPSRGQDMLLHGAIAYHASRVGRAVWEWACASPAASAWLGAALGVAIGLPKEIGDGLHEDKGFSIDDMAATVAGAVLPALHRTVPPSRAVSLKVNYWPSAEFRNRPDGLPQLENDYAGQRYFLALTPGRLPRGAGPWPDWLGLAVGHSVSRWASAPPMHEWYVTLDLDLRGVPVRGKWWRRVTNLLDQIHFPLPGIRIADGTVEVGLY